MPVPRPAGTIADGLTPPFVGAIPLEVARDVLDEVVLVTEEEILEAMRAFLVRAKLYVEGSGATAAAPAGGLRPAGGCARRGAKPGGGRSPAGRLKQSSTHPAAPAGASAPPPARQRRATRA